METAPRLAPEWITSFLAVVESGGVLAAARTQHLSQPALSIRIRRLEDAVGQALFDRTAQGMTLTAAGQRLLPVARDLSRMLQAAIAAVDPGAAARVMGPLRLAVSTTLADFVFPGLLAEYAREVSLSGLDLRVGNTEDVLAAVRGGRVALGAVEGLTRAAGLRLERLAQDEILPVYAPDKLAPAVLAELAKARTVRAIARLPLLWREPGSGTRQVIEAMFKERGVPAAALRTDYVLGGTHALKQATLAGLGIAFLPGRAIAQELALRRLVVVERPLMRINRVFSWVLPAGVLSPELEAFRTWVGRRMQA